MTKPADNPAFARHHYMSPAQCAWLFDLINSRVGTDTAEFPEWRERYLSISDRAAFESALKTLKALPVRIAAVPATATEEGVYMDPATLVVYRLTKTGKWGEMTVSVYSQTARPRKDLVTGEKVNAGTWRRLNAFQSRMMLTPTDKVARHNDRYVRILQEWMLTDEQKAHDFAFGICMFCFRGLSTYESVTRGYGPKCAVDNSLPWGGLD